MKIEQLKYDEKNGWNNRASENLQKNANLVMIFASRNYLLSQNFLETIKQFYPNAIQMGGTTAGEILDIEVNDNTAIVTAIQFEHTQLKGAKTLVTDMKESRIAGEVLAKQLQGENLVHVLVISDGLKVNGSELVAGMTSILPTHVAITGGLAGDGTAFEKTLVFLNDEPESGKVVAIGFYGNHLKVGYGSMGGWDAYGIIRKITKSQGNILYELDGQPALAIYKTYLGELAKELPASALLFPLSIRHDKNSNPVVRTILAVDEKQQAMIFAGDVPEGSYAQFMKANFDRLVDGAAFAANTSYQAINSISPSLAILISCVGRKLILKQRIEEETEAVRNIFGKQTILTGFYSYGEISPFTPNAKCELHNQTMTITTFTEH